MRQRQVVSSGRGAWPRLLAGLALATLAACASVAPAPDLFPAQGATPTGQRQLALLASFLPGHWRSSKSTTEVVDPTPTTLHQVRFWADRPGEFWLYAEYSRESEEDRPYRQRVYRLGENAGRLLAIEYLLPGEPGRFAGEWRREKPFAGLSPADLVERAGCRVEFHEGMFIFVGNTVGKACAPLAGNAAYEQVFHFVSSGVLKTWDRGFDAAGTQVSGSRVGHLDFRRVAPPPAAR